MNVRYLPLELDMAKPDEAGATLASQAFVPILSQVQGKCGTPEDRIRFWTGALAALTGAMAASIGATATEQLLEHLGSLAHRAEAEMAREHPQGRH